MKDISIPRQVIRREDWFLISLVFAFLICVFPVSATVYTVENGTILVSGWNGFDAIGISYSGSNPDLDSPIYLLPQTCGILPFVNGSWYLGDYYNDEGYEGYWYSGSSVVCLLPAEEPTPTETTQEPTPTFTSNQTLFSNSSYGGVIYSFDLILDFLVGLSSLFVVLFILLLWLSRYFIYRFFKFLWRLFV